MFIYLFIIFHSLVYCESCGDGFVINCVLVSSGKEAGGEI
jgi:hypothetical protein